MLKILDHKKTQNSHRKILASAACSNLSDVGRQERVL